MSVSLIDARIKFWSKSEYGFGFIWLRNLSALWQTMDGVRDNAIIDHNSILLLFFNFELIFTCVIKGKL